MDFRRGICQNISMRLLFILGCFGFLAACSGDPKALGITGPGLQTTPRPSPAFGEDTGANPGAPISGTYFGPSNNGPVTGASGFWGYN